jgi:hypothetical protein
MSGTLDEPKGPGKARFRDKVSVVFAATRHRDTALCFTLPLAAFVAVFVIGRVAAPTFGAGTDEYSSFFSTGAQVIVAVLIALAFDLGKLPAWQRDIQRLVVGFSLGYIALGAASAVLAVLPNVSPTISRWLFAATLAAGTAAVLSVLTISYQVAKGDAAGDPH